MSLFNLERFRYQKEKTVENVSSSVSSFKPEQRRLVNKSSSEKENYPERPVKPDGRRGRGKMPRHALEDVSSDDEACKKGRVPTVQSSARNATECEKQKSLEMEEKLAKLLEMFPQRNRSELLELIESTSTLEGAVACCLVAYKDKDLSKTKGGATHSDDDETQPKKRRKTVEPDSEPGSEEENHEPSKEKQDALVHKLKKKFPKMDKVVLREVLREHEWDFENALGSLLMFSSESDSNPKEIEKMSKPSSNSKPSKSRKESSEDGKQKPNSSSNSKPSKSRNESSEDGKQKPNSSSNSKPSKSRQESSGDGKQKPNSSLTRWLSAVSSKSPSRKQSPSNKSTSRGSTTVGHKPERAKADKLKPEQYKDSDDSELDSEAEDVSDEFDSDSEDDSFDPRVQEQILQFLQEASLDELSLISGCSLKKAQKIISLRPFNRWKDVNEQFYKDNGLSMELVHGCRSVLKKRQVLKQLMNKCESIARKMTKDITKVIENGMGSMKQPITLNSKLKLQPYQLIGLKWLILLHQHNLSGILADEMGLGKTIQAISFLAYLHQKGIKGPHLITVPSSTVDNWVRELELWCPSLKVIVYYGSVEDRKYLRHDILNNQVEFNVIVSTYNLTIGNESDRSLFRKLKLQCAVFDEGHMLKNMNSLRYCHLMTINAEQRLLLTGTPLQNNLLELISLLNFIMPSMFSSSTSQISKMFSTKSSEEESSFHKDRIAQAKLIMKPFILRRVKSEVLKELPPKVEKIEMCPMSDAQQQLYDGLFSRLKNTANGEKQELSNVMMQLRKMANHPLLHRQYYTTEKLAAMSRAMLKEPTHFDADPALIQEDMEVMSDFELHNLCKEYSSISRFQLEKNLLLDSGKFSLLTKLLAKLKEKGDRAVLFSQFTMVLDIVEILLKHLGHQYVRLDGSTPMAERIGLIDKYNTDPEIFVFLLSTRAGGQGINLASANVVILHDIDCNPFNDKQAEDRCHRMGQSRTVQVIKLISKDSIEACMLRLGQEKLKLEQDMTTDDGEEGSMSEDVAELLKVSLGL
ncbi:SWI/SNF-related matrix-associated actin-dependent regulator of chromatin subfamily A containing DEAD/H box 1A isoform X2 [Ictalurus punctatus]|uniref:DNA helicase n=1 Tax=Ictalurus punctatus TaxID=7998 RepID=A0A2D0R2S8_ICTPU|nr:SWI/SNF-related matrix-associated actin-dependent regulator of chromatin subfamily A containing DEAD/H box 1A isoform X2 [Ictalurus punctatus]